MTTICKSQSVAWIFLALGMLLFTTWAEASPGDFYTSEQVKVVGHLALNGQPARRMVLQQEGRKDYLYVRQPSQQGMTVVDVTKPARPKVVDHIPQQNMTMIDSRIAIAETPESSTAAGFSHLAGNIEGARGGRNVSVPESVRVLDESDPAHPHTVRTFHGVTDIVEDNARQLIYVANGDGIWILSHKPVLRRHGCSSSDAMSAAIPNCD